jgi:hypothetical protein
MAVTGKPAMLVLKRPSADTQCSTMWSRGHRGKEYNNGSKQIKMLRTHIREYRGLSCLMRSAADLHLVSFRAQKSSYSK